MRRFAIITTLLLFSCGGGGGGGGGGSSSSSSTSAVIWNSSASTSSISAYKTTEYNIQIGLGGINAAEAYALLATNDKAEAGSGVVIAVVDSGILANHAEISGKYQSANSYDYINNDSNATDDNGHGTFVAGIAVGKKDNSGIHGVAYKADVMAIKVLDTDGTDNGKITISEINEAATKVVSGGAKIANFSLGGSGSTDYLTAFGTLKNGDVLSVAATGNAGLAEPDYPALNAIDPDLQGYILAVASYDVLNDKISDFSNRCGAAKSYCLLAPGGDDDGSTTLGDIPSSYIGSTNSYAFAVGTSMAAPHVSGAAAVLRAAWPHLTALETGDILLSTATDLGDAGVDSTYGHGLLNLEEAVQAQGEDRLSFGSLVSSPGYSAAETSIITDPIFGDAFSVNVAGALNKAVFFDSYGRDFKANLGDKIAVQNSRGLNLSAFVFSNIKTDNIPLNFGKELGFKMNFMTSSFDDKEVQNRYGLKYMVVDNSIDPDSYLKNGFSFFSSDAKVLKGTKVGLSFNVDEVSAARSDGVFENLRFLTQNSYVSSPYQSFFSGSNFANDLTALDNNRNFNQIFLGQDILPDTLSLNFSYQSSYDSINMFSSVNDKQNELMDFGMNYKVNDDLGLFLSVGEMKEFENNMLNSKSYGAFETLDDVTTNYTKISLKYSLSKNFNLLTSYSEGITDVPGNKMGVLRDFSDVRSRATSYAITYNGFYNSSLGFGYQEPLRVYDGDVTIDIATARDNAGNLSRHRENVSLVPNGKQKDYEVFYLHSLAKDANLNFNLVRQVEPGSVKDAKTNYLGFMQYKKIF